MMMCQRYDQRCNNKFCDCDQCSNCESKVEIAIESERSNKRNNNKRKSMVDNPTSIPSLDAPDINMVTSSSTIALGVFGVDAKKRINLWNEQSSAAIIIKNNRIINENNDDGLSSFSATVTTPQDQDHHRSNNGNEIIGMSFDNLFPSSSFLSSSSSTHPSSSTSTLETMIPFIDILDRVIRDGKAITDVDVKKMRINDSSTGHFHRRRKITRRITVVNGGLSTDDPNFDYFCDQDGTGRMVTTTTNVTTTLFSVDLFPQFDVTMSNGKSKRIVTGVVLVCTDKDADPSISLSAEPSSTNTNNMNVSALMSNKKLRENEDDDNKVYTGIDTNLPMTSATELSSTNDDDMNVPRSLDDDATIVTAAISVTATDTSTNSAFVIPQAAPPQQQQPSISDISSIDSHPTTNTTNNIITDCSLRKLIDTANAPIFGTDRDGMINEWNDKTAEITGYEKKDAFGTSLVDMYINPNIRNSIRDRLDEAINDGKCKSNYEIDFRTKYNQIRHLLVNITPQRDMNNNIIGVVMIAQDVTEAVKRDRAMAGMALELRQLIDTANAPIFGIDTLGNVNEWNRRTSEITEYAKEEATGMPLVQSFIAPLFRVKVDEILECALAGIETSNYELEVISKSGESIFLLVNATTRRDPDGLIIGVVGVAQDVTEDRKKAKTLRGMQTLRASQEAKVETERNMTAYFAHELRNPLGAIDCALNSMPDNLPESAMSLISGMQLCSTFMSKIMNNLLDVRKMEEGKMQLRKVPISLRKLLYNVHKMLLPSVRPGVDFRTTLKDCHDNDGKGKKKNINNSYYENDWILGDPHRIEQVLTNVVSNAIKYTMLGHIELSIKWEDGNVKFTVEDTGPGIPVNEQKKLFQRFIQRGGAPGTGLGLAIAKHIVDLTGGSIQFESDPTVKAGTSCIVLMNLPLCKAPETTVKKSTELIQEPISCLIIDDIKMNRTMLKRRFKKGIAPNCTIREAATGEEALLICGKEKFDVIVVDQFMEGAGGVMVGTDVIFAMRRMRIDSIIIGCSGNDIGSQFIEAGAEFVWQKPMPSNDQIIQDLRTSLPILLAKRNNCLPCPGTHSDSSHE
mmetsp:Transcript_22169/g.24686  ORF Transcript_22169/g.24686 Transcript_22169/m.24686 type:complete len:1079 (-) Transcript_22169:104-3340(-)